MTWYGELVRLFQSWTGMILPPTMQNRAEVVLHGLADNPLAAVRSAVDSPAIRQQLIDELGMGMTWFGRDVADIQQLVQRLQSASVGTSGQPLTLWSVGCSSGEEPYTLAMALHSAGLSPRILATDINRQLLARAWNGEYPMDSIAALPTEWKTKYFSVRGNKARISPEMRSSVVFELHNLALSTPPPLGWSRFDAIVCRNVLIYFDRAAAAAVIERLSDYLNPSGCLLVGAIERALLWKSHVSPALLSRSPQLAALARRKAAPAAKARRRGGTDTRHSAPAKPSRQGPAEVAESFDLADTLGSILEWESHGDVERAVEQLRALSVARRLDAAVHLALGGVLSRASRPEEAVLSLRAARFLNQSGWLAPYLLAKNLEKTGQWAAARQAYAHALSEIEAGSASGSAVGGEEVEALAPTVADTCRMRLRTLKP